MYYRKNFLCVFAPNADAILQEQRTELTRYLQLWKLDSMFLKTSIRTNENISALMQFMSTSNYEHWVNDGFGPRSADFEWQGKQYQIVFYSKKMDADAFQDCDKEYMLILI